MDLFFRLPEFVRRDLFHISPEIEAQLKSSIQNTHEARYDNVARIAQQQLPKDITYRLIDNPYKKWRRMKHGNSSQNLFKWGNRRRRIPTGTIKDRYNDPKTAYIVNGYGASGSYAQVNTFVVYNGHIAVLKKMEEDSADFFELVIQHYLSGLCQLLYSHICVPSLLFIQRGQHSYSTDVCMERGQGKFLADLRDDDLLIGLACVLRSLWFLQRDVHFMHRDLSGANVMVDLLSFKTTLIDFGLSCVNPNVADRSWQNYDDSFYIPVEDSHATKCTNRSHDVCTLVSYLSIFHPFLQLEHTKMQTEFKKKIDASHNERAKTPLRFPKRETQFTTIKPGWTVGNELKHDAATGKLIGRHWWVFNMVEFPLEQWYPEKMMTRLLQEIPLEYWSVIRNNWCKPFDACMPTIKVRLDDGREGFITKCVRNKLRIRLGLELVDVSPQECSVIRSR